MHNAKHLIKLSSKSTVAVSFQIHKRETLATTIAVPGLLSIGLNMLLVPANIPFFASSPYKFFCFLVILANISLFTFFPYYFILVHVKFVRVEIGLGNM